MESEELYYSEELKNKAVMPETSEKIEKILNAVKTLEKPLFPRIS